MKILGVNIGIGPSVCVLGDGVPLFAVEEERISREKSDMGVPTLALGYLRDNRPDLVADIDGVALANKSIGLFSRASFQQRYHNRLDPPRLPAIHRRAVARLRREFAPREVPPDGIELVRDILPDLTPDQFRNYNHHDCHAAAAYLGLVQSSDERTLVLTLDGGGDSENATVQIGHQGRLDSIARTPSGNSLGNLYSNVTYLMGLTPHEHEYKLMGLAGYVPEPHTRAVCELLKQYLWLDEDNPLVFRRRTEERTTNVMQRLERDLRRCRFDNIAGGLQRFTEELTTAWVRAAIKHTGIRRIVASGGSFMNIVANARIADLPEVEHIDVFPSCGDETNSFGAAFLMHMERTGTRPCFSSMTLGMDGTEDMELARKRFDSRCHFETFTDPTERIASLIADGKIVVRCSGPMEFGARALGNRSILADPCDPEVVERINRLIKQRDFWMPFAPAVRREDAADYLVLPASLPEAISPFMMFNFQTYHEIRPAMAAALHRADKTARAQIVDLELYPEFHAILTAFKALTGRAVVLNTSFNLHGHPIVANAVQALEILSSTDLDAVFLGNTLVTRKSTG